MKLMGKFSNKLCLFVMLMSFFCVGSLFAAEPLILLDKKKLKNHDWTKAPKMQLGYKFDNLPISDNRMLRNSVNTRYLGEYQVNNAVKQFRREYGGHQAHFNVQWMGPEILEGKKDLCDNVRDLFYNHFGKAAVWNDRTKDSGGEKFERQAWQWKIGNSVITGDCEAYSSDIGSSRTAVIMHKAGFVAQSKNTAKEMTPILGLHCNYSNGIKFSLTVDKDETELRNLNGRTLDDSVAVTDRSISSSFEQGGGKVQIRISRIDGASELTVELSDGKIESDGNCTRFELAEKLF